MDRVKDKNTIIVGGAKGLGFATATLFAQEGANIAIVDLDEEDGLKAVDEINAERECASFYKGDVRDEGQIKEAFAQIAKDLGSIDILVNSAGVIDSGVIAHKSTLEEWRRVIDIDLTGSFITCKTAIPYMLNRNGSIVNIASTAGLASVNDGNAAYHAAKGGVVMLTKNLAYSYAKLGISVNCVCPGTTITDLVKGDLINKFGSVEKGEPVYAQIHPMGRLGKPIETAYAILYLASDEASFTTGAALPVDGGFSAA